MVLVELAEQLAAVFCECVFECGMVDCAGLLPVKECAYLGGPRPAGGETITADVLDVLDVHVDVHVVRSSPSCLTALPL